jgi:thioesterase domain-containing protein
VLPDWSGWLRGLGTADIAAALEHPDLAAYLRAQPDPARARRQAALVLAHERALRTYVAPVSDLAPHVFRAQETHGQGALRPAWETVATGGVSEHVVPGDHFTVLRQPHVRALARDVAAALGGAARPSNSEAGA